MQINKMFSYSIKTIFLFIILLLINIILIKVVDKHKNKRIIKRKHLLKLSILESKINRKYLTNRESYKILSNIIRNFIYEIDDIKIQNYSLSEIKNLNNNNLFTLIEKCYKEEFSKHSKGNINKSITKAKELIKSWK